MRDECFEGDLRDIFLCYSRFNVHLLVGVGPSCRHRLANTDHSRYAFTMSHTRSPLSLAELRQRLRPLCEKHRIRRLEIFGSAAHGQATPGSDVDLLVTMEADQLGRLHDILQAARLIEAYVRDTTAAVFAPTRKNKMRSFDASKSSARSQAICPKQRDARFPTCLFGECGGCATLWPTITPTWTSASSGRSPRSMCRKCPQCWSGSSPRRAICHPLPLHNLVAHTPT